MTLGHQLRQDIPVLHSRPMHYLDNAATALMPAAVLDAVRAYDDAYRGNVGRGVHRFAEAADAAYAAARREVATALNAAEEEVIFTAGATAALNLLAQGLGDTLGKGDTVLLSLAEHHSNIVPWQIMAAKRGARIVFAAPQGGAADGEELLALMEKEKPRVIAVAHATNVGGGVADIAAIAAAKAADAVLVVDGAQYAPHHLPALPSSGADFYVFSGHKCYAPNGIGVLWGRRALLDALPAICGGGGAIREVTPSGYTPAPLPQRLEPGTPPVSPAVGLGAAMQWRRTLPAHSGEEVLRLSSRLRDGLAAISAVRLLFPDSPSTTIVAFNIDGVHAHDVCEVFSSRDVAVRGGHHCAEPLMAHLGINGCVRASIAPYNTDDDIDAALAAAEAAIALLK